MKKSTTTIASQIDQSSKQAYTDSVTKISRLVIYGSNVNPAVTLRMKGLLSKKEFVETQAWYAMIAQREAKRLIKKYPFVGASTAQVA